MSRIPAIQFEYYAEINNADAPLVIGIEAGSIIWGERMALFYAVPPHNN